MYQLKVSIVLLAAGALNLASAGTVIIDFESFTQPGTEEDFYPSPFDVAGFRFTGNFFGNDYLIHQTGSPHFAGSTALAPFTNETHTLVRIDGLPFHLVSFDYAESFNFFGAGSVTFTGNFAGGGSISQLVTGDGIFGFQNVTFPGFTNLSSVVFAYPGTNDIRFQLDNIVLTVVPEPAGITLLGIGLGAVGLVRRLSMRRKCGRI